ncbi:MAG: hypothetical protein EA426_07735 [Spirochaetaceae bacterium]|nr:MAG: hypothetical protein EA426_07735 [Spirochaetaceae bacterium]
MSIVATASGGLEEALKAELAELGMSGITIRGRTVRFEGGTRELYRANAMSRVASRFLVPIARFKATSRDELYEAAREIPWHTFIDPDMTFSVDSWARSDVWRDTRFLALKVKDALVDRVREVRGRRPSVNSTSPDLHIEVHAEDTMVTISRDSTGAGLHVRGYRNETGEAPLRENIAAGLVRLSEYSRDSVLIDPMCGSGTIAIEAALIARSVPPGILRRSWAFMRWKDFDPVVWSSVRREMEDVMAESRSLPVAPIIAADRDSAVLSVAKRNASRAGVGELIEFRKEDLSWSVAGARERHRDHLGKNPVIVMNPPYGERMTENEITSTYTAIGDTLKRHGAGFTAWILTGSKEGVKSIGLRASRRHPIMNGGIDCRFLKYELYEGTGADSTEDQ